MHPVFRRLSFPVSLLLGLLINVLLVIGAYHFLPRASWIENEVKELSAASGVPLKWHVTEAGINRLNAENIEVGEPPYLRLDTIEITREDTNLHIKAMSGEMQILAQVPLLSYETDGIKVDIPEVTFMTGAMQPDRIIPLLHRTLQGVGGSIKASGIVWLTSEGKVTTNMEVALRSISGEMQGNVFEGVDGDIRLRQLWPPQTEPKQEIRIAHLESGLPLDKGIIIFSLEHPKLMLDSMQWQWGDGLLETKNVALDFDHLDDIAFTFTVKNIPLQEIVQLDSSEFYSDGAISGKIPVHIKQGKVIIKNGILETPLAGIIRYNPTTFPGMDNPHVALVFSVLQNFFYQRVKITLNSDEAGIVKAHMALSGKNPDVYAGRQVDLNIRLEGNIFDLLKSGMDTYNLPDKIIQGLGL
ncbi:MAG: hypothetical protein K0R63_864 [Rickettsiales bacterium]|jgi:hypothetical protein|nr:hypothetical protein [Rickettsiales bacterium]